MVFISVCVCKLFWHFSLHIPHSGGGTWCTESDYCHLSPPNDQGILLPGNHKYIYITAICYLLLVPSKYNLYNKILYTFLLPCKVRNLLICTLCTLPSHVVSLINYWLIEYSELLFRSWWEKRENFVSKFPGPKAKVKAFKALWKRIYRDAIS